MELAQNGRGLDSDLVGRILILACIWFLLASRQSLVNGLFLPLLCGWRAGTGEQRNTLTWWLPALT